MHLGRLGQETGIELLTEKIPETSEELLKELEKLNEKRKQLVIDYIGEITRKIDDENLEKGNENLNTPIVVYGKYNEGIVGIVAAKLVEKYSRPAIVLSETEERNIQRFRKK